MKTIKEKRKEKQTKKHLRGFGVILVQGSQVLGVGHGVFTNSSLLDSLSNLSNEAQNLPQLAPFYYPARAKENIVLLNRDILERTSEVAQDGTLQMG